MALASEKGYLDTVTFLVRRGADIHAFNDDALRCASEGGHLEVTRFLISSGADIHANNDEALKCASKHGHLEVTQFLVQSGANIHANDDQALRWAFENGHSEVTPVPSQQTKESITWGGPTLDPSQVNQLPVLFNDGSRMCAPVTETT